MAPGVSGERRTDEQTQPRFERREIEYIRRGDDFRLVFESVGAVFFRLGWGGRGLCPGMGHEAWRSGSDRVPTFVFFRTKGFYLNIKE